MMRVLLITLLLQVAWACDRGASSDAEVEAEAGASPAEVCARLAALRAQATPADAADDSCAQRMPVAQELDGPKLWKLRSECILEAATLDEALRCNRANHPEWPEPAGSAP